MLAPGMGWGLYFARVKARGCEEIRHEAAGGKFL